MDTSTLSNNDEEVIHRTLHVNSSKTSLEEIDNVYETVKTSVTINTQNYKKVALQFPDELLDDAAAVVARLRDLTNGSEFYVLGDTSYGSCCVDEVAAEHVSADVIVHYGRACMSPTTRENVIYVLGNLPLDVESLLDHVKELGNEIKILLVSDTRYMNSQGSIETGLIGAGYDVTSTELGQGTGSDQTLTGRKYTIPEGSELSEYTMLYIGPPSPTLTTTLMTHSSLVKAIYTYNPLTSKLSQETSHNAALRRRYATVQKARDAGVIGIVVGTLGVSKYLDLITHLRQTIANAHKKSYLLAMGKLNPSKLANFAEVDCFVLVACGENSLIESKEFFKPVVTPYELSLALGAKPHEAVSWTGDWITDFDRVIAMPKPDVHEESDDDAPHFSLVTGKYESSSQPMYHGLETADDSEYAMSMRNQNTTVSKIGGLFSPAAQHLRGKGWGGLGTDDESLSAEDRDIAGAALTQGRTGVARDYGS